MNDGVTRMERTTGRGRWHHEDAEEMRGRPDEDDRTRMQEEMRGRLDEDDGATRTETMASREWRGWHHEDGEERRGRPVNKIKITMS